MPAKFRLALAALLFTTLSGCAGAPAQSAAQAAPVDDAAVRAASWHPGLVAKSHALNAYFYDLGALQAGRLTHLRIVQIGDSHTAGDYFSGDLRDTLQARDGNGGIGTRVAGLPYIGVRQKDMTISQSGLWHYHNSLTDHDFTDYGISGFTAVSRSVDASLSLTVTDPRGFDKGFVEFVCRHTGGFLQIDIDGVTVKTISTYGPDGTLGRIAFHAPSSGAHQLTVVAKAKGIEVLGWNTERNDPGVIYDSFGVVGSTAGITQNWNPEIVSRQLAWLHPALIILAYGTNEGAEPDFDPDAYGAMFGKLLYDIHHWSPGSAVLIISPTDGSHQSRDCTGTDCPWLTLPALDAVRQVQAQQAQLHYAAVWNAAAPEQDSGGMNGWAAMTPPLARGDHLHFTATGYSILANALDEWLTAQYTSRP
jgi:lysophospholipase L1-like esterase